MATAAVMEVTLHRDAVGDVRELTTALTRGDEVAFRQLHALYFDRLLRYLFVVTRGNEDAAHEALQQTFIRIVRYARCFESEPALWSWLTRIARSAAQDGGRRRIRYWQALQRYAQSLFKPHSASPEPDFDAERLPRILDECLAILPPEERTLVERKYYGGATVRELARETGLSEKSVESRLVRARRALRELMRRRLQDET